MRCHMRPDSRRVGHADVEGILEGLRSNFYALQWVFVTLVKRIFLIDSRILYLGIPLYCGGRWWSVWAMFDMW
ncbi:hypothetical protein [Rubritalea tangerina]|uniref:hypothetical protein n=1 Tax=Rubritalea tangerina TaxID=430798 RepID=UPI0036112D5F